MESLAHGAGPMPASLELVAERVERRLTNLLDRELDRWSTFDPELAWPLTTLARLVLGGGKRLRPAFVHWGHVAAGGDPDDPRVTDAGAAFEMLHAFALVHDDVMDGSALRRGHPTAHLEFSTRHGDEAWRGEPRRFGEGIAILVGDLAHVYADHLATGLSGQALDVWNELRVELIVGQMLDMFGTAGRETDREAARLIGRYKSGKYTIERPLHLGAALAQRLDELRTTLSAYGDPLGEAFQLRDDLLGAFGDAAVTGKPVGDDLREGKPTPLLASAVRRSDGNDAELLRRVGSPDLTDDEIAALQFVLVDSGARADVETTIDTLADRAITAVKESDLPGAAVAALVELAEFVAYRDR